MGIFNRFYLIILYSQYQTEMQLPSWSVKGSTRMSSVRAVSFHALWSDMPLMSTAAKGFKCSHLLNFLFSPPSSCISIQIYGGFFERPREHDVWLRRYLYPLHCLCHEPWALKCIPLTLFCHTLSLSMAYCMFYPSGFFSVSYLLLCYAHSSDSL